MRRASFPVILISGLTLAGGAAWAQSAISARAGMIHYSEGRIAVDGQRLDNASPNPYQEFKFVNEGETLTTERGRAEILLNPGTFLRVSDKSAVKLISSELEDTRIRLESGSAMIEVSEFDKLTSVAIEVGTSVVRIQKQGLYEFTADQTSRLRVYEGEATVAADSTSGEGVKIRKGRELSLDLSASQLASVEPAKFDRDETDSLYNWTARRARMVGTVNQSSALLASTSSFSRTSSWIYNPLYDMYTYLPGTGYGYSPFGYRYYSPVSVLYVPTPMVYNSGNSGNSGINSQAGALAASSSVRSGGTTATSVGTMSAPAVSAPAVSAPSSGGAARRR